jgi:hypothetical protein
MNRPAPSPRLRGEGGACPGEGLAKAGGEGQPQGKAHPRGATALALRTLHHRCACAVNSLSHVAPCVACAGPLALTDRSVSKCLHRPQTGQRPGGAQPCLAWVVTDRSVSRRPENAPDARMAALRRDTSPRRHHRRRHRRTTQDVPRLRAAQPRPFRAADGVVPQ